MENILQFGFSIRERRKLDSLIELLLDINLERRVNNYPIWKQKAKGIFDISSTYKHFIWEA